MIISPLRYPGGKSRLYSQIKRYFPKNEKIMIDLFFGGGSVGLNWLLENKKHELIINDIDNNLINFWNKVKNNNKEYWQTFIKLTENLELTKHIFKYSKLSKAIDYLIRNKCSFNGLPNGTWSVRAFKENFNKSTFDRINKCHLLLKNVNIYNLDYKYFINKDLNGFYYLDPPYMIENAKKLYKNGDFNHYELKEILSKIENKWILSINDCQEIRNLYQNFNIYEIKTIYTSSNTNKNKCKKVKELVITNFNDLEKEIVNNGYLF